MTAQMADRCYLEKCRDRCIRSSCSAAFAVSHGPGGLKVTYGSGLDVLRQTPEFAPRPYAPGSTAIRRRLPLLRGAVRRPRPYMEAIERNSIPSRSAEVAALVAAAPRPPAHLGKNALQNMRALVIQHLTAAVAAA